MVRASALCTVSAEPIQNLGVFFILSWFLNCLFLRESINKNSKTKNYFLLTREVALETSCTSIVLAKYFDDLSVNGS